LNPTTTQTPSPKVRYTEEILASLAEEPPRLPSKYFYDATGSRLFDAICALPEYYLTRTETGILERDAKAMAAAIGPHCELLEYGSGSSTKTTLLLDALVKPARYIPIDVSRAHLHDAAQRIHARYPDLSVEPLCADFAGEIVLPSEAAGTRVAYFPGSTLGNLTDAGARGLLERMTRTLGPGGLLLIGVDLVKPESVLVPAYDDAAGVTAAFNRNLLVHLQSLVDLQVNPTAFEHRAIWNADEHRMEMWLEASSDQVLELAGQRFAIPRGKRILTEFSHKYTPERLLDLAAGFDPVARWSDPQGWFLVQLLRVRG